MAKSPGNIAKLATRYYLDIGTVRNSVSGAAIITTVYNAANTGGTVTDAQYNQYIQYTAWRFSTFIQHHALSS